MHSLNVLIVEDSEHDAALLLRALRRSGFEPAPQRVGVEAELRNALQEKSPEIVLSDYSLFGFDGPRALGVVKELRPEVPFIFVSAPVGQDAAVAMMRAGARDFILRTDLSRLGQAVERELREAKSRRDLQQSEAELRNREARFRSIIENISDIVLLVDTHGTIGYCSPSTERILGYSARVLTGRSFHDLVHPDDRSCTQESLARRTDMEPSVLTECRIRDASGSWRIFEGLVTNLLDEPAVHSLVCTFRDATERKRAEKERFRAQRLQSLGSLAGGIAHDLNNMLTPILIAADLLIEQPELGEYQALLDGLRVSAHRAADAVQHLLSFARSAGGERETLDVAEVLRELERLLRFSLPKSIVVQISAQSDLWQVSGDKMELLQLFVNLSLNARDAMPSGGRFIIEAKNVTLRLHDVSHEPDAEPGAYVHFRVTDTGLVIAPENLHRVFEPYVTTKEQGQGSGMGLSTSLSIVRNHGGFMKAYSERDGRSLVSIYLPAQSTKDAAAVQAPELPRGNGETILIVDDEASIREVMKEMLAAHGYRALAASMGAEALEIQSQRLGQIKVAIVDAAMPLMDGLTTIRALKQREPMLPIILQGRFLLEASHDIQQHVSDTLQKPYTIEQLLHSVARIVRQQQHHN